MVMSRIQKLDPENASKIMGYILIQDQGDNEMISPVVSDQLSFFDESKNVDFMDPMASPGGRSDSVLFPYPNENASNWGWNRVTVETLTTTTVYTGGVAPLTTFFSPAPETMAAGGRACTSLEGFVKTELLASSFMVVMAAAAATNGRHSGGGVPPFPFNRCMNFLNENPRSAAALMMGDEFHKFGRCRPDRNDFAAMGFGNSNSSARQIYLTFPADSTFKEEDVSNYFSMFGPVQDVRIPYQQKRMFGFVTFMLPETVKAILAKGNPHFVCDSRVLVKPYKEKGKIPDKYGYFRMKHQQQMERGDFSGCLSPTALESAEPFDHIPFGARMFNQEMILRRKLEERAELQQAMELQDRRLMNLQLSDLKNHHFHPNLSVSSPTQINQNPCFRPMATMKNLFLVVNTPSRDVNISKISTQDSVNSLSDESDPIVPPEVMVEDGNSGSNGTGKEESSDKNKTDKHESLEHILPDNLFASPTKSAAIDHQTIFSIDTSETDNGAATVSAANDIQVLPTTSTPLERLTSLDSCYYQMP
ncbi:hypothetical protein OSB04_009554, partial [Centaurea solstitialis]